MNNFENFAQTMMEKYDIPGCIVAIAEDGKITYEKTFGYRDVEAEIPVDRETVFGIASLTKSFTCVGIMQLVEQGKIDLNAPITTYLPTFEIADKDALDKITVHHFMTHSSGLPPLASLDYSMERKDNEPPMVDYKEIYEDAVPIQTYDALLSFIRDANVQLLGAPGAQFSYSNDAYGLLGKVIENVSGMPYETYLEKYVFAPCGLTHTHFTKADYGTYDNIATNYEKHETDQGNIIYPVQDWWDAPPMRATGFLKSTAADMLRYSQLYMNKGTVSGVEILTKESVEKMVTGYLKMDPLNHYGYGFSMPEMYYDTEIIEHGGSLQSVSSKFGIIREKGVSVIVLANLSGLPSTTIMHAALNDYFGRPVDAYHIEYEAYDTPEDVLREYVGHYQSDEGMDIRFVYEDGQLTFYYKDVVYPVRFIAEHVFLVEIDDGFEPAEVLYNEAGEVTAVSMYHRIVPKV